MVNESSSQSKISTPSGVEEYNKSPFNVLKARHLILICLLLVLLSIVLHWTIPRDAGLGVAVSLILYAIIVGTTGSVLVGIFLWLKKIPRNFKSIGLVVVSWIVVPIIIGPILSLQLLVMLFSFYDSEYFITSYQNKLSVNIKPQKQSFTYAYCKLEKYTAKYTITSKKDIEVIFALIDTNSASYLKDVDLPFESISEQFEFIGDAFVNRAVAKTLGMFKIPAGTHTFEVNWGKSPFLLAVYYPKPLLTPQLIFLNEKDYPKLHVDTFTISEASSEVRKESCQGSRNTQDEYYLNKYVYIPNAEINLYKGTEKELYLYNQRAGNSSPDEFHLISITETRNSSPSALPVGDLYKTVTNKYSKQQINIYLTIVKKSDPYRIPYLPIVDYEKFIENLHVKGSFSSDEQLYLNRTGSFFWIDKSIQFDDISIDFNSHISPYDIQKVIEIIENIEPSKFYSKEVILQ